MSGSHEHSQKLCHEWFAACARHPRQEVSRESAGLVAGVLLTNITTTVSAALIAIALRPDIDWRRYRRLAPLIVVGSVPGALLVDAADRSWLEVDRALPDPECVAGVRR